MENQTMISSTDNSQISLALGQKDVKFLNGITAEQILSQILESDPNSSQEIILIKDHIIFRGRTPLRLDLSVSRLRAQSYPT